jgi:hypothetical protein
MTDPRQQQREDAEDLELEAETVKDLDPDADDADEVRGGRPDMCPTTSCQVTS